MALVSPSRATIGASLVLAVALLVGALAAAGLLRRALSSDAQSLLVDRVDEVQTQIADGLLARVFPATGREVGQVQVVDAAGRVVAVTLGLADTTRLDVIAAPAAGHDSTRPSTGTRSAVCPARSIASWPARSTQGSGH